VVITTKVYGEYIDKFSMNIVKPINILLAFNSKIYSSLCPGYEEEKVLSHIPYVSTMGSMYVMKWSRLNISHVAVGVVSGHMENPGKEHWEWVIQYLRGTMSITYSGCNDLVCGYVDLELT
jgi:hypothetical protein